MAVGADPIVVPFPAGASVDAVGRLASAGLQQRLGVTVVVENRPGASGSSGSALVAKAPPDGNTWLVVFDTHAVNPTLLPNFPFDNDKDLEPVSLVATAPYVVGCNPSRPYKTVAELIPRRATTPFDHLCLGRQRQHRASGHGAARQASRRRSRARALSRRRAGDERRGCRSCRSAQRQRGAADAADCRRQDPAAIPDGVDQAGRAPRRAHHR